MEIYNANMEPIQNPDLSKGRLKKQTKTIEHPAVEAVAEVWHYETINEYPNGGKEVKRVVDAQGVQGAKEWTETVEYFLYTEYTPEELAQIEAERKPSETERIAAIEEQMTAYEQAYRQGVQEA